MVLKTKIELRQVFDRVILADSNDTYTITITPTFAELYIHKERTLGKN